jgi:AraC family transcriptional activator of pobA
MNVPSRSLLTGKLELPILLRPEDESYTACTEIIDAIVKEYQYKKQGYEVSIKSQLHVLLLELARTYGEPSAVSGPKRESAQRTMERLKDTISYIETHYAEKLSMKDAARIARMSPYHFSRVFKQSVGNTFTEYIHLYRINKAETLLRGSNMSITRIAEQTGFGTIQYLDQLFKRYRGCTPNQLRRQT